MSDQFQQVGSDWQRETDAARIARKSERNRKAIGCLVLVAIFATIWAGIAGAVFVAIKLGD